VISAAGKPPLLDATERPSLERYGFFFSGAGLDVWLVTNVFSRSNSFLNPGTKSLVPYSNNTTKLKVKNKNKATQKVVRSRAMAATLTYSVSSVNGGC